MRLSQGQQLVGIHSKKTWTIQSDKCLGEGGQGQVWLVSDENGNEFVLKWYFPHTSNATQEQNINNLVVRPPNLTQAVADRFVMPIDMVKPGGGQQFGYIMKKIDTKK
jgi:hypothetical protein